MNKYVLGIDQSTQGTKGLLFDEKGALLCRADLPHKQYIDERGWVEHDPEEIYTNTLQVVKSRNRQKRNLCTWNQQSERNRSCLGPQNWKTSIQCSCMAVCKRK